MTDSRHLHHRRAFGHRAREPQSGFSPTAIFGLPLPTGLVPPGLISDITQISEYLPRCICPGWLKLFFPSVPSAVPGILDLTTPSTKVSTSTTSLDTTTSTTSTTNSTTTASSTSTSTSHTVTVRLLFHG